MNIKKEHIISLIILLSANIALAGQKGDLFLHLDGGLSISRNLKGDYANDIGNAAIIGAGVKYQLTPKIKLGGSFTYRAEYKYDSNTTATIIIPNINHKQKIDITSLMLNSSYDLIQFAGKVTPYLHLGAGCSRINLGVYNNSTSDPSFSAISLYNGPRSSVQMNYNFTWNAGIGSSIAINEQTNLDFSYKYTDFGRVTTTMVPERTTGFITTSKGRLVANEFLVSLQFKL